FYIYYFLFSTYFLSLLSSFFFFHATAPTEIYTLSLHDALPIWSTDLSVSASRLSGPSHVSSHSLMLTLSSRPCSLRCSPLSAARRWRRQPGPGIRCFSSFSPSSPVCCSLS